MAVTPVVTACEAVSDAFPQSEASKSRPQLCFPGGGMFFYWQIGAVQSLVRHYDLANVDMTGASAGALAACLATCQVDCRKAAEAAFQLSVDNKVWETGLRGVWSRLIREWLRALLPEDAAERCRGRLHLYVLNLPSLPRRKLWFSRTVVSDFADKEDLIDCCLASVHIPLFMDGKPWTRFRGHSTMDGSVGASREDLTLDGRELTMCLDYTDDEAMQKQRFRFLSLGDEKQGPERTWQWIEEMMDSGEAYAEGKHAEGLLCQLEPVKL